MYQICFLWKLSQGFIEGNSVNWQLSERRGIYVIPSHIPRNIPSIVNKTRERPLFNILPKSLRNENSSEFPLFKNQMDIQRSTAGLARPAASNSLLDQVLLERP